MGTDGGQEAKKPEHEALEATIGSVAGGLNPPQLEVNCGRQTEEYQPRERRLEVKQVRPIHG